MKIIYLFLNTGFIRFSKEKRTVLRSMSLNNVLKLIVSLICYMCSLNSSAQQTFYVTNTYVPSTGVLSSTGTGATDNSDIDDDRLKIYYVIEAAHAWSVLHPGTPEVIINFPATTSYYRINSVTQTNTVGYGARLRNYIFQIYSNMRFEGAVSGSTIKIADGLFSSTTDTPTDLVNGTGIYRNANLFYGINQSNISFKNLIIDFNGINNLLPSGQDAPATNNNTGRLKTIYGIIMDGGSNLTIDAVTFKNNPGLNDIVLSAPGSTALIQNCIFKNGGRNIGSNITQNTYHVDFSFLYSDWENSTFFKNSIIQEYPEISLQGVSYTGGIEIHANNAKMLNNYIFGCKPAVFVSNQSSAGNTLENILIQGNQMIDCFNGITFWAQNLIDGVTINYNWITTMFLKNSSLFTPVPNTDHNLYGIGYPGGNRYCHSDYEFQTCNTCTNANLSLINNLLIDSNTIVFDTDVNSIYPSDVTTTGILLHSIHNSTISRNVIKGMNWSGISLAGSPWLTKNLTIKQNDISQFEYSRNGNGVGYFVITDTYIPNNKCNPNHQQTFRDVTMSDNKFTPNAVVNAESLSSGFIISGYSEFKGMFFDLPSWYAYNLTTSNPLINSFKNGSFTILPTNTYVADPSYPAANTATWYSSGEPASCPTSNSCGNNYAAAPTSIKWFDILSDNVNTIEEEVTASGNSCLKSASNANKCNIGYRLLAIGGNNPKWTIEYLQGGVVVASFTTLKYGDAITILRGVNYPTSNVSNGEIRIKVESIGASGNYTESRYFACFDVDCPPYSCNSNITISGTYSIANTQSSSWIKSAGQTIIKNNVVVKLDATPTNVTDGGYVLMEPVAGEFFLAAPETETASFAAQALDGCGNQIVSRLVIQPTPSLTIYPNPATESFTIVSDRNLRNGTIQLFDINGKFQNVTIQNIGKNQVRVNCSVLSKGVYLLKVNDKNNSEVKKVVIL